MVPDRLLATVAQQLGHPSGLTGRVVGRVLNRSNKSLVTFAVEAAEVAAGSAAVDVGYGGGVGLGLLLDRVGPAGIVHGVELSETMLASARRRFRRQLTDGRLQLHQASVQRLPLPDGSVAAAVSINTIYFIDDLDAALRELARVIGAGGRLVLGIGDPGAMAKMPVTRHGFTLRPVHDIVEHARRAGFAVLQARHTGGVATSAVIVCDRP